MRILFLTLLVLNLGFLGYHLALGGDEPKTEDIVLPGQDVATLEPLPPLPKASRGEGEEATSEAEVDAALARATGDGKEEPEVEEMPEVEEAPEIEELPGPEAPEPGAVPESGAGPEANPGTASSPAPDAAAPEGTEDSAGSGSPDEDASAPEPRPTCYALGPLSPDLRDRIEDRVAETSLRIVERWQGDHAEPRYWVHLPPAPDMDGARERQEALKAAGYRDILLVRNGDMARSISLGVFADRANAAQHQQRLQADGFDARITEQSRHTSAPFLGLAVPADAGDALAGVRRLIEPGEAALTERPCDRLHGE